MTFRLNGLFGRVLAAPPSRIGALATNAGTGVRGYVDTAAPDDTLRARLASTTSTVDRGHTMRGHGVRLPVGARPSALEGVMTVTDTGLVFRSADGRLRADAAGGRTGAPVRPGRLARVGRFPGVCGRVARTPRVPVPRRRRRVRDRGAGRASAARGASRLARQPGVTGVERGAGPGRGRRRGRRVVAPQPRHERRLC